MIENHSILVLGYLVVPDKDVGKRRDIFSFKQEMDSSLDLSIVSLMKMH